MLRNKKSLVKVVLMGLLTSSNVIWGGTLVHAEEPNQAFTLDPMVVTAQREEKRDVDTPASVAVLTQQQLVETGAANLFDALRLQNGITSYSYGAGGQAWGGMNGKILMRGADKGTVVMIDGAPINMNETYFLDTFPVESIERVEIVKGASSVLYGSEASGGVINIITKKSMKNTIALTKGEYGKAKEALTVGAGKLSLAATFEQGDEIKKLANNGRGMNDADKSSVLVRYKFNDNLTLSHQHNVNDYKFNSYVLPDWNKLKEDGHYVYIEDYTRLQYKDDTWTGNLFYNRSNRKNKTITASTGKWNKEEYIIFDTIGLDLQKKIDSKFADFIIGTTISQESYKNDTPWSSGSLKNLHIDVNRKNYALFVQMTKNLGNDFIATIGAREQFVDANKTYDAFTPEFSLLKKLDENSSVYINAAKSFRMPTFMQLYGSGSPNYEANPLLKPEEGWTYEIGYKKASDSSMFKAALYYMDNDSISYESKIDPITGESINKIINAPFENLGFEINYDKKIGSRYSYALGANFCNPKAKDNSGNWNRKFARQQYTGSIKYNNEKVIAALTGSITAARAGDWPNMIPVNFYTSYKFDKNSKVQLDIENIFNRQDIIGNWTSSASTEYYSMPRNVKVTYIYTF